jgi:hypothetical protein
MDVDATPLPDDDTIDITPRPVTELAERTVILATIARRGMLDVDTERDHYERETDRFDLVSWVRSELGQALTRAELDLLSAPVGDLDEDDLAACDDALIGASTIAWALGVDTSERLPVPQDGEAEQRVLSWAPNPWNDLGQIVRNLDVRDEEVLAAERERWELWYWRALDADDADDGFAEVIAEVQASGLIPTAAGDLATDAAEPFGTLSPDEQADIAWLAELRLRALNWACGLGETWETTPLYPD